MFSRKPSTDTMSINSATVMSACALRRTSASSISSFAMYGCASPRIVEMRLKKSTSASLRQ
jgi:hypothetical protein